MGLAVTWGSEEVGSLLATECGVLTVEYLEADVIFEPCGGIRRVESICFISGASECPMGLLWVMDGLREFGLGKAGVVVSVGNLRGTGELKVGTGGSGCVEPGMELRIDCCIQWISN